MPNASTPSCDGLNFGDLSKAVRCRRRDMYRIAFRMGIPRQGWSGHRFRQTGPATAREDEPARGCLRLYQRDDLVQGIIYTKCKRSARPRFFGDFGQSLKLKENKRSPPSRDTHRPLLKTLKQSTVYAPLTALYLLLPTFFRILFYLLQSHHIFSELYETDCIIFSHYHRHINS